MLGKPWFTNLAQVPDVTFPEKPVEFKGSFAFRDVIRLRVDEREHDSSADVYAFVGPESYLRAEGISDATLTPRRVSSRCVDAIRGSVIESRIWKDGSGRWHAKTVDGSAWLHDKGSGYWLKAVGCDDSSRG